MPSRPRHPKTDANQSAMVNALRQCGLVVLDVSSLGGDCLDLFVGDPLGGGFVQVEVKTDGGVLTPGEAEYIARYAGPLPIVVARRAEDVLIALGRIR